MNLFRQLLIYAVIFVVGVSLFALVARIGIALGLATETARWLVLGGLVASVFAIVVCRPRRR
jgi:hypothetical protein